MPTRLGGPALLVIAVLLAARAAVAQAPEPPRDAAAQRAFDDGVARATAKDYDGARRAFAASYERAPRRDALFAWAQAERLAGHCEEATTLYRRFLAEAHSDRETQAAQIGLRRCAETAPPPLPPPIVVASAPVPAPAPEPSPERSRATTPLLVGGGVALAAGGALLGLSFVDDAAAADARSYDDYRERIDRGRIARAAGLAVGAAGVVATALGAFLLLREPQSERRAAAPRLACTIGSFDATRTASWACAIAGRFW